MAKSGRSTVLVDAYLAKRPALLRFFALRLRSEAAAEDIVQEIYVKLASLDPEPEVQNPVAYLYRLGTNLMLDRARGAYRSAARDSEWRASHTVQVGQDDVADQPRADDAVAARERLARIVEGLGRLPPLTQTIFRLHKFDGLTHLEVAHRLGISRSSVEKHVSSALRHLLAMSDPQ